MNNNQYIGSLKIFTALKPWPNYELKTRQEIINQYTAQGYEFDDARSEITRANYLGRRHFLLVSFNKDGLAIKVEEKSDDAAPDEI